METPAEALARQEALNQMKEAFMPIGEKEIEAQENNELMGSFLISLSKLQKEIAAELEPLQQTLEKFVDPSGNIQVEVNLSRTTQRDIAAQVAENLASRMSDMRPIIRPVIATETPWWKMLFYCLGGLGAFAALLNFFITVIRLFQ